jgi:hypothetical protein
MGKTEGTVLRVIFGMERDKTYKWLMKLCKKKIFRIYYIHLIIQVSAQLVRGRVRGERTEGPETEISRSCVTPLKCGILLSRQPTRPPLHISTHNPFFVEEEHLKSFVQVHIYKIRSNCTASDSTQT